MLHAALINDVATVRRASAAAVLDLVGMTRAHLADPHIARKIAAGLEQDIRPCVGATYCLDRIYEGQHALCIHDLATGREATMPHAIGRADGPKKRVVVVGACPAGLEPVRVAAVRGHRVTLLEAADQPDGQIRLAARTWRRAELIGIADWRSPQCRKLGVEMRFNHLAEADDILSEAPETVIVATGGLPNVGILPNVRILHVGDDLVVSSWAILAGDAKPGAEVLLFDDNGAHPGLQAAKALAGADARLEIVTPERHFAPEIGGLDHVA